MASDTVEVLQKAKALIDAPEKWTKGAVARDEFGARTTLKDPQARCFCSAGAVRRAAAESWRARSVLQFMDRVSTPKFSTLENFNDHCATTHADVMAAFDRAIELAKTEA